MVILKPDREDPSDFHLYNSAATKLRDDLYLMVPSGFFTKNGTCWCTQRSAGRQAVSAAGTYALLSLGKAFDSKGLYVAPGVIPGEAHTYWFYYFGYADAARRYYPHQGS